MSTILLIIAYFNSEKMTDLQEKYRLAMNEYNLYREVMSSKTTYAINIQEYYSKINQRIYQEPYKNIEINLLNIPKIDKPPFVDRNKWMIKQL